MPIVVAPKEKARNRHGKSELQIATKLVFIHPRDFLCRFRGRCWASLVDETMRARRPWRINSTARWFFTRLNGSIRTIQQPPRRAEKILFGSSRSISWARHDPKNGLSFISQACGSRALARASASVINYLISTVFNQLSSRALREYRIYTLGPRKNGREIDDWMRSQTDSVEEIGSM